MVSAIYYTNNSAQCNRKISVGTHLLGERSVGRYHNFVQVVVGLGLDLQIDVVAVFGDDHDTFQARSGSLADGTWRDGWHAFCEAHRETYTKAIGNACKEDSTAAQNQRFAHRELTFAAHCIILICEIVANLKGGRAVAKYMTRQRMLLLAYLEQHPDVLLSANQIAAALAAEKISVSAIYRNLSDLEAEGKVRRTSQNRKREVYFQYIDAKHCKDSLHLNCQRCGRSYHLSTELAEVIIKGLASSEDFQINKANTVIYGICSSCSK